ncbi:MAG: hypothetical protein WA082_04985 [Candidatus Moraniibacteriota bacterium]
MQDFRRVSVGSWNFRVGPDDSLPQGEVAALEQFINGKWLRSRLAQSQTYPWAGLTWSRVPSPIIRIDMGPSDASGYSAPRRICEVEERPGGLGSMLTLCPEIKPFFSEALAPCSGFVFLGGPIGDDATAAKILGKPFCDGWQGQRGMFWVRHDTLGRNTQYSPELLLELEQHSVVPIRADGDKSTLVHLELASPLDEYLEKKGDLPWGAGFCVKPTVGTWTHGVHIHHPQWQHESSGRNRIAKEITGKEAAFLFQPLIPPRTVRRGHNGSARIFFEIQRVFLAMDKHGRYRVAGGITMGAPSLKVHGTPECYVRPIVIEK